MHSTTTNRINTGKNDEMKQIDQLSIINEQYFGSYHQNGDMITVNKDDNQNVVLLEISFQNYTFLTLGTPILALIITFLLGFLSDYQQILNYDWTCGPVEIPSFSRIINLSKERIIWNAAVLFHLPLRILLIAINYRICRIPLNEENNHKLHMILSRIIILSGSIEILMALFLTVIGEREETPQLDGNNFNWHVYFFIIFAISSMVYFTVVTVTYRNSKHYKEHFNGHWSFKSKFYLTLIYCALIPATFVLFAMYWILCYNFAYHLRYHYTDYQRFDMIIT